MGLLPVHRAVVRPAGIIRGYFTMDALGVRGERGPRGVLNSPRPNSAIGGTFFVRAAWPAYTNEVAPFLEKPAPANPLLSAGLRARQRRPVIGRRRSCASLQVPIRLKEWPPRSWTCRPRRDSPLLGRNASLTYCTGLRRLPLLVFHCPYGPRRETSLPILFPKV